MVHSKMSTRCSKRSRVTSRRLLAPRFRMFSFTVRRRPPTPIENNTVTVVPWVWQGRHDGNSSRPTPPDYREIVSGVTMVRSTTARCSFTGSSTGTRSIARSVS